MVHYEFDCVVISLGTRKVFKRLYLSIDDNNSLEKIEGLSGSRLKPLNQNFVTYLNMFRRYLNGAGEYWGQRCGRVCGWHGNNSYLGHGVAPGYVDEDFATGSSWLFVYYSG